MGTMFQMTGGIVAPAPGTRLIRAEEYSRLLEAGELLAAARGRADAIRAEAEEADAKGTKTALWKAAWSRRKK